MIDRKPADAAPEAHNVEQDDEGAQAQTLADEALARARAGRRNARRGRSHEADGQFRPDRHGGVPWRAQRR